MKKQNVASCVLEAPTVVIGTLVGFDGGGAPLVDVPGGADHLLVRSCVPLGVHDIGKELVLVSDSPDSDNPIVVGMLQPRAEPDPEVRRTSAANLRAATQEVEVDGTAIAFTARDTITLRCGEASITLNRDGKIVIRGVHVVSHANGVNRIRGGSIQLN